MSANLINMIINDIKEIDMTSVHYSEEQNIKRIKRGKPKHRDKLFIKLGGKLKVYAQSYRKHRGEIQVRFMVRGFWRHFRADKFINKKGTKRWIYPHSWSGQSSRIRAVLSKKPNGLSHWMNCEIQNRKVFI